MTESTAERTKEFIRRHPHIRTCLQKDVINYSALARHISAELDVDSEMTEEAILVATRRFAGELEEDNEAAIRSLLERSELTVMNKIAVAVLDSNDDALLEQQRIARDENRPFYLLDGSSHTTVITHERYLDDVMGIEGDVHELHSNLALLTLRSDTEIEQTPGVVSYLTTLFAEHGVNIIEMVSCWTDTVFVIDREDLAKALQFLEW